MILYVVVQLTVSNTYFLMFQYDIVGGSVFESFFLFPSSRVRTTTPTIKVLNFPEAPHRYDNIKIL